MSKPTVAYWDFRGLGHPIRNLLAYAGVDFIDKRYSKGADGKGTEWLTEKPNLGFDFPNLPYLIDGNVKLTQSSAILRYLGRKYGLDGATEGEKNRIALLENQLFDLTMAFFRTIFGPTFTGQPDPVGAKAEYVKGLGDQLNGLANFLGDNQYSAGASVTYVDFLLYEYLVKIALYAPEVYGKYPNLAHFVKRLEAQPKLAAWRKAKGPEKFLPHPGFDFAY